MPRYRRAPLTLAEIQKDGPPVRLRDLVALTGLNPITVRRDIYCHALAARKRVNKRNSTFFVGREEARRWLLSMGIKFPTNGAPPTVPRGTSFERK